MRTWLWRVSLCFAIAFSWAQTASPVSAAPVKKDPEIAAAMAQLMQRYADCIMEQADSLEKSGEAASAIASAAAATYPKQPLPTPAMGG
jgi:hypothetical protein